MFSDFTFDVNEIKLCQISLKKTNFIVLRVICKSLIVDNYLKKKKANIGENILGILSAVQSFSMYFNILE